MKALLSADVMRRSRAVGIRWANHRPGSDPSGRLRGHIEPTARLEAGSSSACRWHLDLPTVLPPGATDSFAAVGPTAASSTCLAWSRQPDSLEAVSCVR